jgi:hypothetical protein
MIRLAFLLAILLFPLPGIAQTVVLSAKPTVKVESSEASTKRYALTESEQEQYRVIITRRDGRYFWSSRENRELIYHHSGAFHYFTDLTGGGYIKIIDTAMLPDSMHGPGPRFRYMEHLTLWLGTITY